jgi:hypothetical protein
MSSRRNKAQRAAAAVAALTGTLLLMTSTAASQTADGPGFANGTASATTQGVKVNPTAAALSIGVTFGTALAGYTNEVAKAESRGIDLGIIGTTLAGEPCDGGEPTFAADRQPQPLAADSRDADAAAGKTAPETFDKQTLPGFEKYVRATNEPLAESRTIVVPLGEPGALAIGGVHSTSITRVVDKKTREAIATTEIGSISVGGGAVKLANLKWEAVHRTGAQNTKTATFTIGSATIGGALLPIPLPTADPAVLFGALNPVLAPFGVELRAPASREVNGSIQLDPLVIGVVPSPTRDSVAGQLLNAVQPVREAVVDALLALDCGNDTYVTVADIALGSITGAGSFSLELGGATAFTAELAPAYEIGDFQGPTTFEGTPDEIIPGSEGSSFPAGGATAGSGVLGDRATKGAKQQVAAPIASTFDGKRGGKLALLAGGVLLLLAAVAELDRRKMLAALKTVPITEA